MTARGWVLFAAMSGHAYAAVATRALLFTYVNPAVPLVAGAVLSREPLTWFHVAGLAGSVLSSRVGPREPSENVAHQ